jgi:hypothetical protein
MFLKIRSIAKLWFLAGQLPFDPKRKVGCIDKNPMFIWNHQLSCCESFILLSVFNSYLFPSSSSMHRLLRDTLIFLPCSITRSFWGPLMKFCSFTSEVPSEIRQFKFMVSWLCVDHIAVQQLRPEISMSAPLREVEGLQFLQIDILLIFSRKLVDDSRMGTAIGPRSRYTCQRLLLLLSTSDFLCGNGATLFFTCSDDVM